MATVVAGALRLDQFSIIGKVSNAAAFDSPSVVQSFVDHLVEGLGAA